MEVHCKCCGSIPSNMRFTTAGDTFAHKMAVTIILVGVGSVFVGSMFVTGGYL